VLRRRKFFRGGPMADGGVKDVAWLRPDGQEMTEADWGQERNHTLGMLIAGRAADEQDERGRPIAGDTLLLVVNGGGRARSFTLPTLGAPGHWHELVNTMRGGARHVRSHAVTLGAHTLALLRYREGGLEPGGAA
jgi:glycogen operon protein